MGGVLLVGEDLSLRLLSKPHEKSRCTGGGGIGSGASRKTRATTSGLTLKHYTLLLTLCVGKYMCGVCERLYLSLIRPMRPKPVAY